MRKIVETLEFFNADTMAVVKKKSHKLPMEHSGLSTDEDFFKQCVDEFLRRRKQSRGAMDKVEMEEMSKKEYVITITPLLKVEYSQRWTYKLE